MSVSHKLLLIILDGWGIGKLNEHNAVYLAKTPFFDHCLKVYPCSSLDASGPAVGLLKGQIGSSEVGHIHIGAGRLIQQELTKINLSLKNGSFYQNQTFLTACNFVKKYNTKLHLLGLLSDGGVHSHQDHLFALLRLAKLQKVKQVYVHIFLDGRDAPPASGLKYLKKLEQVIAGGRGSTRQSINNQKTKISLATVCGRYYAMDRDNNLELTQKAINLMINGQGARFRNFAQAVKANYRQKIFDEFAEPAVLDQNGLISQNDAIICFNFRADRSRQLLNCLLEQNLDLFTATMTDYGLEKQKQIKIAFVQKAVKNHLCQILSENKIKVLKITETQKYPHLTYFFNGGRETAYPGEDRLMIPSKKVKNFAAIPEMSAREITKTVCSNLDKYPVIMVNFANGDMVGHSGDIQAGVKACECLDQCLKQLCQKAQAKNYQIIITSDHGNVEEMYDLKNDSIHTAHTTNPVPFILLASLNYKIKPRAGLANIAPAVLKILNLKKPQEMGEGLLI